MPNTFDLEKTRRDLYRAIRTLPTGALQFAFNMIELIEGDVLSMPPWGDHKLQRPEELFRVQVEGLERALGKAA